MKMIPLSKGMFTVVDDEDYERLSKHKWLYLHRAAARADYFYDEHGESKQNWIHMHREIVSCPVGMEVDHINRMPLDNRKSNLRVCTHQENSFNHPGYGNKGVHKITNRPLAKPYMSRITHSGKNLHLGYFETLEEAMAAYDSAAMELFGDFAKTNFEY